MLEEGDSFYVLEEGFWGEFQRAFSGKDPAADAVGAMIGGMADIVEMVRNAVKKYCKTHNIPLKDVKKTPYGRLLESSEFRAIIDMNKYHKKKYDPKKIVNQVNIEDPIEIINRIRDELFNINEKGLAKQVEDMIPKGAFGKIKQVWNNVFNYNAAKGGLTGAAGSEATEATEDNEETKKKTSNKEIIRAMIPYAENGKLSHKGLIRFLDGEKFSNKEALDALRWNKSRPKKPKKVNMERAKKIYDTLKQSKNGISAKGVLKFLDKHADKVSAKELMAVLKYWESRNAEEESPSGNAMENAVENTENVEVKAEK